MHPISEEERLFMLGASVWEEYRLMQISEAFVCGHCNHHAVSDHFQLNCSTIIKFVTCPNSQCRELNIFEMQGQYLQDKSLIYPRCINKKFPSVVPEKYVKEYNEALNTLSTSIKASAAISRHCLQMLLKNEYQVKKTNLKDQIKEVLDSGLISPALFERMTYLREVGNFGSHPNFDEEGELYPVEFEEAELSLMILELIFDEFFVKPAQFKLTTSKFDAKKEAAKAMK